MSRLQLPSYKELSSLCKKGDAYLGIPFYVYDMEAHPWVVATNGAAAICLRLPITAIPLPEAPSRQIREEIEGWLNEDLSYNSATIVGLAKVREWAGTAYPLSTEGPCPGYEETGSSRCKDYGDTGLHETHPEVLLGEALGITINRVLLARALSYVRFPRQLLPIPEPNITVSPGGARSRNLTFRAVDNTWLIKICERITDTGHENVRELYIR